VLCSLQAWSIILTGSSKEHIIELSLWCAEPQPSLAELLQLSTVLSVSSALSVAAPSEAKRGSKFSLPEPMSFGREDERFLALGGGVGGGGDA
jgi:hypothetical protein